MCMHKLKRGNRKGNSSCGNESALSSRLPLLELSLSLSFYRKNYETEIRLRKRVRASAYMYIEPTNDYSAIIVCIGAMRIGLRVRERERERITPGACNIRVYLLCISISSGWLWVLRCAVVCAACVRYIYRNWYLCAAMYTGFIKTLRAVKTLTWLYRHARAIQDHFFAVR